jgi:flavoprotein
MAREDDLTATKRAPGRARMECDMAEAVWQDYQARMHASIIGCQRSLDFDRVLRGRQFNLTMRETDLERWEKLAEE